MSLPASRFRWWGASSLRRSSPSTTCASTTVVATGKGASGPARWCRTCRLANPGGALYRFDANGVLSAPVVDELITQNGLAWSPDGTTMYLSDSHPLRRQIWAFDYDVASGEPRNRRVFADLHHYVGRPDGAAVDADGCYWICANDAGLSPALHAARQAGPADRRAGHKPAMCAFGGANLDTLFVTSIRPAANANEHDGHLFAVRPGVTGLARARIRRRTVSATSL